MTYEEFAKLKVGDIVYYLSPRGDENLYNLIIKDVSKDDYSPEYMCMVLSEYILPVGDEIRFTKYANFKQLSKLTVQNNDI